MGYNIDGMAMERFVKVHPGNPKAGIGFTSTTTMKAYLSLGFTTADERLMCDSLRHNKSGSLL